ncbi:CPBP family intramembrane glutamic endopeptidase [Planococcus halocryophilus]|uniref:CPBP family intramembrane glutamic endopeptidase n=1 Tax=Planococcus halocryophilus TaxID=1215089 RepID=UPI001F0D55AF|nr:type II CAAX endopeptidase family protein [Planococcus halocryophilus]MCH4827934.1 CPBP family intramembrane metalloprotease [Planococcus halocryophilus]
MKKENHSLRQIGFFLFCTFSITWLSWLTIIIGNRYFDALWYGEPLFWLPMLIGGLGPAFGSYIIYRKYNKEFGKTSFFKFVFGKKINRKAWLIFGFFITWRFLMIWIAFGINEPIAILYMFLNLPLFIIGGGLEELGWRGFLQSRLERVVSYFPSVIIVGIIWSIWHLPLWLILGTPQSAIPFELYAFLGIVLSFSFTAIYKYTKSLLLTVLSHAWFNGCIGLAVYIGRDGYLQLNLSWIVFLVFIVELIMSATLVIAYNRKK